ncbi:GNAT family N-acetyltransferase [Acuticoccus sp.]|uniref:GNAT family N-acetyltransferase n=1 Tax=Acuticoccus sp. TaxID=1904378 RepID=UPI003B5229AF
MRERTVPHDIVLRPERPDDADGVEALYAQVFGPGRHARMAYRLREGATRDHTVSVVAVRGGLVIGAVRQVRVLVGGAPAYLLGPLAVAETAAKQGIGGALMHRTADAAAGTPAHGIVLVGDPEFYEPLGYRPAGDRIVMPGPVERHRVLERTLRCELGGPLGLGPWLEERSGLQPSSPG